MSPKNKIEKYVKNITKNETYSDYLTKAAEFGFGIRNEECEAKDKTIADLQRTVKTYEDLLKNDVLSNDYLEDDDY